MRHGFAAITPVVDDESKSALRKIQLGRYRPCLEKQMSQERLIFMRRLPDSRDRLLGDDQDVHWRLRIDVPESEDQLVLIDDIGRNLTGDYFFKKRLTHTVPPGLALDHERTIRDGVGVKAFPKKGDDLIAQGLALPAPTLGVKHPFDIAP